MLSYVFMWGVATAAVEVAGGTRGGSYLRARDTLTYGFRIWQLVAQVGRNLIAGPEPLLRFYGTLAVFQFDVTSIVHPDCVTGNTFVVFWLAFSVVLFLYVLWLAADVHLLLWVKLARKKLVNHAQKLGSLWLILLYPLCTAMVNKVTDCVDDGETLVLRSNSSHRCVGALPCRAHPP